MASAMKVVPAAASAAFETTTAATPANGLSAAVGADPLTALLSGILAGLAVVDSASTTTADQGQVAAGQLGSTQVQSYVERDDANAQALSDPGVVSC